MGQSASKGMASIANEAFPHLAEVNLEFNRQDQRERAFKPIYGTLRSKELLPQVKQKEGKSNDISEKLRTEANEIYIQMKATKSVLGMYTKAICVAKPDSQEIALAYASRSAVTFELKGYDDSIKDIDRALAGKYPNNKSKLYTRRGRCFMALSQYSKALKDFKQAKSQENADQKGQMIDNLIKQCQNKPDKPRKLSQDPIQLSHPPSPYIKSASVAVDIKYSPELGRHLVASVDIKPGDVLAIENPYVAVLKPAHQGNFFCDNCKMKCYSAIPCESCTAVVFCSEDCRQSGWDAYHAIECSILPTVVSLSASNTVEGDVEMKTSTALRILIMASKCGVELEKLITMNRQSVSPESAGFVDGKYLSDDYTAVHHLVTNMESRPRRKLIDLAVYATCLVHLLKEGTEFFKQSVLSGETVAESCSIGQLSLNNIAAVDLLFKYLMIVYINGHSIGDTVWSKGEFPSANTIASAVFAFHSLFNHSCDPNVTHFTFRGQTFYTISIQPIKKGQQIFEDYGYNYNAESLDERQRELKRHYNFACKCVPCRKNWPPFQFLPDEPIFKQVSAKRSIMNHLSRFRAIRRRVFDGTAADSDLEALSQFMILALENVHLPWRRYVDYQDTVKCYMALKAHPELRQKNSSFMDNN